MPPKTVHARRRRRGLLALLAVLLPLAATLPPGVAAAEPSWTAVGPAGVVAYDVVTARSAPDVVYAATASGVLRSGDGGVSWAATALTAPTRSVAVSALSASLLIAADTGGDVWRSEDGGGTWTPTGEQGRDVAASTHHGVVASQPNNITWTAGAEWSAHNEIESAIDANGFEQVWGRASTAFAVTVSDGPLADPASETHAVVYLALSTGLVRADFLGSQLLMPVGAPRAVDVSPDGVTVVAGGWLSTDAGTTWAEIPPSASMSAVALDRDSPGTVAYGGVDGTSGATAVFRSTDGGSWQPLGLTGVNVQDLDAHAGRVLAATTTGLHRYSVPVTPTAPLLANLSPSSSQACAGCADLLLTLAGTFPEGATARVDGEAVATTRDSATQLTASVPARLLEDARTAAIDVIVEGLASGVLPFFVTETAAVVLGSVTESGTDPGGTVGVSSPDGTISAVGAGPGTLTLAGYSANPVTAAAPAGTATFFDVHVSGESAFSSVRVVNCALGPDNGSRVVYWWDGSAWTPVSDQSYDSGTGCVTMTFASTSAPSTLQLTGTVFAEASGAQVPVAVTVGVPGTGTGLLPGDTVAAGYRLKLGTPRAAAENDFSLTSASVALSGRCEDGTPVEVVVPLGLRRFVVSAGAKPWLPTSDVDSPSGYQGSVVVPATCGVGAPIWLTGEQSLTAVLTTSQPPGSLEVQLHSVAPRATRSVDVDCAAPASNPEPGIKNCRAGWVDGT